MEVFKFVEEQTEDVCLAFIERASKNDVAEILKGIKEQTPAICLEAVKKTENL